MVCHSLLQWTTFCQALTSRDMTFSCSVYLDGMPGALVVPLLVITECINLHWLLGVDQHVAGGWGKGPAGVAGRRVRGRLEPMLECVGGWLAHCCPGVTVHREPIHCPGAYQTKFSELTFWWLGIDKKHICVCVYVYIYICIHYIYIISNTKRSSRRK